MAMRVASTPSGVVRVSYSVLAAFLSGLGGLLVVAISNPIVNRSGVCATDTTLLCGLAVNLLAWVVGAWLLLTWLTYVMRLSWRYMVATVALQLVVIEALVQYDSLWWLILLLLVPVVAALVSDPGRTSDEPPRWRSIAILAVGVVVYVEFFAWGWFGVLSG